MWQWYHLGQGQENALREHPHLEHLGHSRRGMTSLFDLN